jgi:hypothetical protein
MDAKMEKLLSPIIEAIQKGRVVFLGEYRAGMAVEFNGKGGKVYKQSKMSVETPTGVITVTEFLPDTFDIKSWVAPFTKGQMVMGFCRSLEETSGVQIVQAKLSAVG